MNGAIRMYYSTRQCLLKCNWGGHQIKYTPLSPIPAAWKKMSNYPSQVSYGHGQSVYEYPSSYHSHRHRHHHSSNDDYYVQQPITYVPSHDNSHRYGRHHSLPTVPVAPIIVVCFCYLSDVTSWFFFFVENPIKQPTHSSHHHDHHHHGSRYRSRSLGEKLRYFFGFAPGAHYRSKSDRSFWGFMGYSRRDRYYDVHTGAEVNQHGQPVYRFWFVWLYSIFICRLPVILKPCESEPILFLNYHTSHTEMLKRQNVNRTIEKFITHQVKLIKSNNVHQIRYIQHLRRDVPSSYFR